RKGVTAFSEPEVVARLQLTTEQQAKIQKRLRDQFAGFGGKGPSPPGGRDDPGRSDGANKTGDPPPPDQGKQRPSDPTRGHKHGRPGPVGFGPGDFGAFLEARSKQTMERILAVLTEQQRAAWQRMIGPPAP